MYPVGVTVPDILLVDLVDVRVSVTQRHVWLGHAEESRQGAGFGRGSIDPLSLMLLVLKQEGKYDSDILSEAFKVEEMLFIR